jgi:peroxiredoxin
MNTGKFVPEEKQSRLPDLYERDQYNRLVGLRSYGAKDYLLVFFYPEADTPG